MTEPSPSRPVPGPPMSAPGQGAGPPGPPETVDADTEQHVDSFADLERLPVAEHVAVFEAEHSRLQDELSTIDQV